jgi:hypothetical protein
LVYFNFADKIRIYITKCLYVAHCRECLPEIRSCKKSGQTVLFHFLNSKHFGFDSMLYDGEATTLVLIRITINQEHDFCYKEIEPLINKKPFEKYKKIQHYEFFQALKSEELVTLYCYQWMTDENYPKLREKSENEKPTILQTSTYYQPLIDEIKRN